MASTIKKTANALSAESFLLNIHSEQKAVAAKHESLVSVQEAASKRVLKWAEGKGGQGEDPAVQDFVRAMYDQEVERDGIERRYIDHYRIFVKLWKGVLAEKKELNAKQKEFESVKGKLQSKEKKVSKAEAKEPRHKVIEMMANLEAVKVAEAEAAVALREKEVEVQQDKHQALRTGYTGLYAASMSRMKDIVKVNEEMRKLVNAIPSVVGKTSEDIFITEPFKGPVQESPIWWQGEQLFAELQGVQEKHKVEMQRVQREHSTKLRELAKKQEALVQDHERALTGRLSAVAGDHDSLIAGLIQTHKEQIASLNRQREDLQEEHAQKLQGEAEKYDKLVNELKAKQSQLESHIAAEKKLEQQLENFRVGVVKRGKSRGVAALSQAGLSARRPCIEVFLDMASQAKASADGLLPVLNSGIDANCELFDTKISEFVTSVSATLLAASGAASSSRAEASMTLLTALKPAVPAATALVQRLVFRESAATEGGGSAASTRGKVPHSAEPKDEKPEIKQVLALYSHEAKEQEGFMLVGFKKGEILELVKRRPDGWSRIKTKEGHQGWGPSSYLQDYEEPEYTPAPEPELNDSAVIGDEALEAPETMIQTLKDIFDEAVSTGKAIQLRDRELARLSNQLVDAIEEKVSAAQQSILDGIRLFDKLLAQSKATESGRLLEVNQQLLTVALKLEEAMRNVINSSEGMRAALLRTKGAQSNDEFNAKHESWFAALTTSVDAVVDGNPLLMEAVRCVLARKGKHEELQVASRSVTAAVAQLAALSRTKSVEGTAQGQVTKNCSLVIEIGNELLAGARESQDLALASVLMEDFEELTSNQIKRLTMATQVNVLKLEKEVEREREKLGQLRRLNYQDE